jgi:predicted PurR-regulated permease PerM
MSDTQRRGSRRFWRTSFLIILGVITALFIFVVRRFIMPTLLAAITAALFQPLRRRIMAVVGQRATLAAVISLVIVVLVFVLPIGAVGYLTVDNAIGIVKRIQNNLGAIQAAVTAFIDQIDDLPLFRHMNLDANLERGTLFRMLRTVPGTVISSIGDVFTQAANLLLMGFVYLYCLYFFLKDGDNILRSIFDRIPLGAPQKDTLLSRFASVSRATIKGTLVIGLFQGLIGGLTVYVVGLPGALVLGVLLVFLAAIPNFGAMLVWLPSSIILFSMGDPIRGTIMVLVGGGLVGAVDYLLRPRLIGEDVQIHQILIFFGVIGGVIVFGVFGLIVGPIIVAIFVKMWELFSEVFQSELAYMADRNDSGRPVEEDRDRQ